MEGRATYQEFDRPKRTKIMPIVLQSLLVLLLVYFSLGYGYFYMFIESDN